MLLLGRSHSPRREYCDRSSRRNFLKIGGLAMGGLSLSQLLALEAQAGIGSSHRGLINIFLPGGPSHIDMWDLKPDAPREISGEFMPIKTNVPGIEICELFPRMATMMDKFIPVRSIVGSEGLHESYQCMTGRRHDEQAPSGGWPAAGAYVSKILGPVKTGIPSNVSLMYHTDNSNFWGDPGNGGFLGPRHAPISLVPRGRSTTGANDDMVLNGITLERLLDRSSLLRSLDRLRRKIDTSGGLEGVDHYNQQAMSILTSSRLIDALDLSQEDPKVVERYGENSPKFQLDGAPKMVRNFLVARRLIEAGARIVSLNYSRWDWHGLGRGNFPRSREDFPLLDQGLAALVTDLHERGLDREVTVIVWGEFGRTPKINEKNSRDHWAQVTCAMMAGGGMATGQVLGATNRYGEYVTERPVSFQEIFATLYHHLGIDIQSATVTDLNGRPQYLLDSGVRPIDELS